VTVVTVPRKQAARRQFRSFEPAGERRLQAAMEGPDAVRLRRAECVTFLGAMPITPPFQSPAYHQKPESLPSAQA